MRCKVGKPARVKWVYHPKNQYTVGWIVICDEAVVSGSFVGWCTTPSPIGYVGFTDAQLEPLSDPGPDAVDEMLLRTGTPAQKALSDLEEAMHELKQVARELRELEKRLTT